MQRKREWESEILRESEGQHAAQKEEIEGGGGYKVGPVFLGCSVRACSVLDNAPERM